MGEWIERLVRKFAAFKADAEQLVVVLDEVSAPMQSRATFLAQPDRSAALSIRARSPLRRLPALSHSPPLPRLQCLPERGGSVAAGGG